jgi:alginate O-acetyltransferase complex protein AlgI
MTLSFWFRDYLYITLGGNRCSPARRRFNLMATMVLGGLWHGANWTFAAWGAWHGALLVLHQALPAWQRMSVFWQRNLTFLLVTLGWVFFRSDSFAHATQWFGALGGARGALAAPWTWELTALALLVAACLIIVRAFPNSLELPLERFGPLRQVGLAAATAASVLLMNYGSKFLYFQF